MGRFADPCPNGPVIQIDPGVEIVREVHPEAASGLGDFAELPLGLQLTVLRRALLPAAQLVVDMAGRYVQDFPEGLEGLLLPDPKGFRGDPLRWIISLRVDPGFGSVVDIGRQGVFRKIAVVETIAGYAAAPCPTAVVPQVLTETVVEHLESGTGRGGLPGFTRPGGRSGAFGFGRPRCLRLADAEGRQLAWQCPVRDVEGSPGLELEARDEAGISGEDRGTPAGELGYEHLAQPPVEIGQIRGFAHAVTVGRVGDKEARS